MDRPHDNINRPTDLKGNTSLHELCGRSGTSTQAIIDLLNLGADINRQNSYGMPPLGMAIQSGNLTLAQCLIENGADIFFTTDHGTTFNALHMACVRGSSLIADMLLKKGAAPYVNISGITYDGRDDKMPCLHAALANNNGSIVDMLLAAGAHVNAEAGIHNRYAPIHLAVQHCTPMMVKKLLQYGADIEHPQPNTGRTPLHLSIEHGRGYTFDQLVALGADINAIDAKGYTPLMLATSKCNANTVRALVQLPGIDIDHQMDKIPKMTALMLAAEEGYSEIINILLKSGANASLTDAFNNTASAIARQHRYEATARILSLAEDDIHRRHFNEIYKQHRNKPPGNKPEGPTP